MAGRVHQSGLPFDPQETKRLRRDIARMPITAILNRQLREEESRRRVDEWKAERRRKRQRNTRPYQGKKRSRVTAIAR